MQSSVGGVDVYLVVSPTSESLARASEPFGGNEQYAEETWSPLGAANPERVQGVPSSVSKLPDEVTSRAAWLSTALPEMLTTELGALPQGCHKGFFPCRALHSQSFVRTGTT
jgi:hypothetical protein